MLNWSVVTQLPEVLRQGVLGVHDVKNAVNARNRAVLGSSLSSVVLWLSVEAVLVNDSVGEDLVVSFDSHDERPKGKILFWV